MIPRNVTITHVVITSEGDFVGKIYHTTIAQLDEALKALAVYYSASYGSNSFNNSCDLTQALGLGKQGSEANKALIRKWFI
ncbi:MAG: hypothetical protein ABI045_00610 [Flavobacteriales bacterium]